MDIRSMVNSEDTPPPRKSSTSTPVKPDHRPSPSKPLNVYESQAPVHDIRREIRPPQPSPLQTQGQNDSHLRNGSAYANLQSPYQQTPPASFSGGSMPPTQSLNQSPSYGEQTPKYAPRESYPGSGHPHSRSFGHSTPLSQTPTTSTPGSASGHAGFRRPSSSHSATTPISAQHSLALMRESPQPPHHQLRTSSQSQTGQQFISQPSTPLGPPLTYPRPTLNIHSGSPGAYDDHGTHYGSSHGHFQATTASSAAARSPQNNRVQHSRSSLPGPASSREREGSESISPKTRLPSLPQIDPMNASSYQAYQDYGRVTPAKRKTEWDASGPLNAPSQKRNSSMANSIGVNGLLNAEPITEKTQRVFRERITQSPSKSDSESEARVFGKATASQNKPMYQPHLDVNNPLFPPPSNSRDNTGQVNNSLHQPSGSLVPPATTVQPLPQRSDMAHPSIKSETSVVHQTLGNSQSQPFTNIVRTTIEGRTESHHSMKVESFEDGNATLSPPARKKPRLGQQASEKFPPAFQKSEAETSSPSSASTLKPRHRTPRVPRIAKFQDVPVYAWSIRGRERTEELFLLSQRRAVTGQSAPPASHLPKVDPSLRSAQLNGNHGAHGATAPMETVRAPMAQPALADDGPLGHWEPSILGTEPMEELTKTVGDFLYKEIMARTDIGVGPAGGAPNLGAVFEIEAKIGQLIDTNTNDRLRLPVLNECVINHASPDLRVKFQSSMTEAQHRAFNKFLNGALVGSQPPKPGQSPPSKPRVPMTYKHTYETDTFYELSQTGVLQLPPSMASTIQKDRRSKAKIRITTEQRSGTIIAKIIKARIADIEVYSPKTPFDWRVSVSVEMDYQGDSKQLVEPVRRDGKRADRNKDRMSYKHQGYQIDLTQVTPAEATLKTEKEHELEIEVSSEEVRKQGKLLQSGQRNDYEKVIRSFVDNVRVLARVCPL